MKTIWKIGIAMILITAVLAFTGYAAASAGGTWMRGSGSGNTSDTPMMAGEGGVLQEYMADAWAQVLEMSVDDVNTLLDQGLTHFEIALQAGWAEEDLPGLMQAAMAIAVANAQADGVITQEQAQFMLQRMNRMQNFGDCEDCEEYQHRYMWSTQDGRNFMHQNQYQNQDCEDCEEYQYRNMHQYQNGDPSQAPFNYMHQNRFRNQDCEDCAANQFQNMNMNGCGEPGSYGPGTSGPNGQPEPASGGQSFGEPGSYGPGGQGGSNN